MNTQCLKDKAEAILGHPVEVEQTSDGQYIVLYMNFDTPPPPKGASVDDALIKFIEYISQRQQQLIPTEIVSPDDLLTSVATDRKCFLVEVPENHTITTLDAEHKPHTVSVASADYPVALFPTTADQPALNPAEGWVKLVSGELVGYYKTDKKEVD